MVGGLMPAVTYHRKPYGSVEFQPIFKQAEELDCALAIHGSPQSGLGLEVFERHIEAHVLSHPLPIAMHCISIVFGGVIEKFPKIRIAFLEAGSSWVPFLMERMDFELERLKPSFRNGAPPPLLRSQGCPANISPGAISTSAARPRRRPCLSSPSGWATSTSFFPPTFPTVLPSNVSLTK